MRCLVAAMGGRQRFGRVRTALAALLMLSALPAWSAGGEAPGSPVDGKKLIMVGFKLWHTEIPDLMDCIPAWQASGLDGMTFNLRARREDTSALTSDSSPVNMVWGWWSPVRFEYSDFALDMQAIRAVNEWGRLTDNFLWGSGVSFFTDAEAPGWFDDEKWEIVLDNTTLLARLTREAGFRGVLFDTEQYERRTDQAWRRMWDYPVYRREGYRHAGEESPRSFDEVSAQVLRRGGQWARRLCEAYPEIAIVVLGSYGDTYRGIQRGEALAEQDYALHPAFLDGVLQGLGESATLVVATQGTYLMSEYRDMAAQRDLHLRHAPRAISSVPDLAAQRLTWAPGLWLDAGYGGAESYSLTDLRLNQRSPQVHEHAVHNALAVSDRYAWLWSEWPSQSMVWPHPPEGMRQYWAANEAGHTPRALDWQPEPLWDPSDYGEQLSAAVESEAAFWERAADDGYGVAVELPVTWKFRLDPQLLLRYEPWTARSFDDRSWWPLDTRRPWQTQGFRAAGPGAYRVAFHVPANVDPETHEVVLACGGLGDTAGVVYVNERWLGWLGPMNDVSAHVDPGERNLLAVIFLKWNQARGEFAAGPGGLMGHVKLLTRPRQGQQ